MLRTNSFHIDKGGKTNQLSFELQSVGEPTGKTKVWRNTLSFINLVDKAGADPGFFLGGGALISCSTSTPINHIVFFLFRRIPVFIRKPLVISKGGRGGCRYDNRQQWLNRQISSLVFCSSTINDISKWYQRSLVGKSIIIACEYR